MVTLILKVDVGKERHLTMTHQNRKGTPNERGESEDADGKGIKTIHVCLRKADNNPDYVDLVEFLKMFKHDPRVS